MALDPTERFLVIANYGTGAVAVMPVDEDGQLQPVSQLVPLQGTPGPDPKEQASSHPHAVIFDPTGAFVVVPDKGFDRTFFFRFQRGRLTADGTGILSMRRPAPAPRHATFHPTLPVLYVNNELDSTVTVFDWSAGQATERQVISTLARGHAGHNTTAEIAASPCGRYLYVSNRGQDSIVQFVMTPGSGSLTYAGTVPDRRLEPRFFALGPDAKHLYVANQDSDEITVFHIDHDSRQPDPDRRADRRRQPLGDQLRNALLKDRGLPVDTERNRKSNTRMTPWPKPAPGAQPQRRLKPHLPSPRARRGR